jgi:carbon storage regulator CsrA
MLVLSRKTGESVVLRDENGKEIGSVIVVRIGPNNTRLGFEFPKHIAIVRGELIGGEENDDETVSPGGGPAYPSLV